MVYLLKVKIIITLLWTVVSVRNVFEEEKEEALSELGDHYQTQLSALKDHIALLQTRQGEVERQVNKDPYLIIIVYIASQLKKKTFSIQKREEIERLQCLVDELRQEMALMQQQTNDVNEGAGRPAGGSTDDEESHEDSGSEEEDECQSSPPTG